MTALITSENKGAMQQCLLGYLGNRAINQDKKEENILPNL